MDADENRYANLAGGLVAVTFVGCPGELRPWVGSSGRFVWGIRFDFSVSCDLGFAWGSGFVAKVLVPPFRIVAQRKNGESLGYPGI
jgi:hypothetical protein